MDETRALAFDDQNLDLIVNTEPQYQPYLRQLLGSPLLNEGWKPSSTNTEMVPSPVSLNKISVAAHRLQESG